MLKHVTGLAVAAALTVGMSATAAADTVRIGWTAWSDAEFITKLTARVIEEHTDYEVDLVQTDIAPQYSGLAGGSIDMMLMSWLPATHENYVAEVQDDIVFLGILYTNARLGWAVPEYVPEDRLSSIADLTDAEVREQLDGTIVGIDPGAGLTQLSEQALEVYGLDGYTLQTSSGAGMTAALDRAYNREDWIVVTGWSPHWKFGAYELRYLEDPEGVLGGPERVHALARKGFDQEYTDLAALVARIYIPLDELQDAMFDAQETSYEEAVTRYIEANPGRINYWVTGEL
ncbi:MAG: glycine betaine ABC transporter substrate-binding protein [Ectothiorhodospiraceae bacterium]|nr:glycine betaine ABC transporter substrate-binding protein [Ectothiorhodospiraceae bacterium]